MIGFFLGIYFSSTSNINTSLLRTPDATIKLIHGTALSNSTSAAQRLRVVTSERESSLAENHGMKKLLSEKKLVVWSKGPHNQGVGYICWGIQVSEC